MKKKKNSLKKRIFALVAVFLIVTLSIVPCFAYSSSYGYANSYEFVPFYFDTLCRPYVVDGETERYESYRFGSMLSFYGESYSIVRYYPISNYFDVSYDDNNDIYTLNGYRAKSDFDYVLNGVQFLDMEYYLKASNFFINPIEDDFVIEINSNVDINCEVSVAYIDLGENSDGEVKTYITLGSSDSNAFYFSLDNALADIGIFDDVFVYAFNINFYANDIVDSINYTIKFHESETLKERNLNLIYFDSQGEVSSIDLNSMSPLEEFFKSLGVIEYKSAFENYTADYTSWIGTAVGGFLNMELAPFFSIGGILLICVALGLVGYFLKVFMGG